MTHDDLVFQALAYRRNVGAVPSDIRAHVWSREAVKHTVKEDLAALRRLEEAGKVVQNGPRWYLTPQGEKEAKGAGLAARWQWEDAWILGAILFSRNSKVILLEHVIFVADFINHDIPTREALHGALNRLASARLLKVRKDTFSPTERALELFSKVEANSKKNVHDIVDGLQRILDCPCCGVPLKTVRWRIRLDEATYTSAYARYMSKFEAKERSSKGRRTGR
jgi:hypothetical protein